eukprot:TRINITY_DN6578_c0_g1_i1.p1 TRINITY_DN6578_c0_g1~~TRINITY_DN6578_c0_g1_i1.p1  ORF type:complete len:310 (+),score=8.10 TRINITY_DN6578_c0_g1_i1:92-931(+)
MLFFILIYFVYRVAGLRPERNHDTLRAIDAEMRAWKDAAKQIISVVNATGVEWWLEDGNQLAALRAADNFVSLSEGIQAIDTDTDIMLKVDSLEHWWATCAKIETALSQTTSWTHCKRIVTQQRMMKMTCYNVLPEATSARCLENYADIHAYVVDKVKNLAFPHPLCFTQNCSAERPFQFWGGGAPYRGLITSEKGHTSKALLYGLEVHVPYDFVQVVRHWNDNEYKDVTNPNDNLCFHRWGHDGFVRQGNVSLTQADKSLQCERANLISSRGYAALTC